jgi:hypothetical protein
MRQQNTGSESNREPQIDTPIGFFAKRREPRPKRAKPPDFNANGDRSGSLSFFGTTGDAESPQV